ncbi:DUF4249 domain-containing protein [Flagellimonas meridianipacifica]|uniref:Uncharacterized protein DUF4249 n=1 Tax=Flagellimonas meridianipacifica TaxID=1080225 RepID=A0A2T0MAD7_9FLAO|nr:DUF4249 domain-containing protein [Allomuricauda pacifica]PRX54474.1 uncharacterized protein DUF4249 [Allomuricauda pacifica]
MRKVSLFIATALLFFSCEDVIDVELPTSEPRLVVDALIGFNASNGDPITVGEVRLTLTAPFFDDEVPPAENASVTITDEQTGEVFPLTESEPGVFSTGFPTLQFDRDYTLTILYDGETYSAVERLNSSPTIDNVVQGDGFLFDEEEETEVIITFTDISGERNNYLFSFGFDNFLVIEDEFFQDSEITFSYFYEDVEPGDLLPITLFGIDKEFATYAELVLTQSGENGGGPFATPPATIKGNIVNTTNSDRFPFGYFAISEFDARFITVTE